MEGEAGKIGASDDLVEALSPVVAALQDVGAEHFVGGSVASSFHGATRSTMDVDLVCDLAEGQVADFIKQVGTEFYVSETAIRQAIRNKSCFNLIHLSTSFKVDIFVSRGRPFDIDAMQRASSHILGDQETVKVSIATAEDIIISKLEWYRLSNDTSQRQWEDVSRLIELLGNAVDLPYLKRSADTVGVADLLERLLEQ